MIALRVHDDTDAELLRLRRDLLAFVVDEITRSDPADRSLALTGPVADAISETAAAATRAELLQLGRSLADEVILAVEPQLTERLPALVQAAVAAALAEQAAANRQPPAQL
ncbi:hypothetical protein, partial [Sandarakinorhabdus oryzae]|uniref:hypothetical protein n=1 Tax=Sandarakinorhabdus oryzae TaxID=2675220 RepID=UPI0018CC2741